MNNRCKFVRNAISVAHSSRFLTVLALAFLLGPAAHAQSGGLRYHLTDLQSSSRSKVAPNLSVAYAINEAGQITGDLVYGNNQYCFIYTPGLWPGTTFTSATASTLWCDARAINSAGDVAGSIYVPNGIVNAFLRQSNGALGVYPSIYGYNSLGWGIDDTRSVVGEMDPDFVYRTAYSWNSAGTPFDISAAYISSGYGYQALATSASGSYISVLDVNGGMTILVPQGIYLLPLCGFVDGIAGSTAYAVNNKGHAVGQAWCEEANDPHAALWAQLPNDLEMAATDLGPTSTAYAISSDDWVVGHSGAWSGGAGDAFLRVSDPHCPTMVNLNLLLDTASTGWKVVQAYGINTAHQIVGQAADSTGKLHAVLLTPDNNLRLCSKTVTKF